MLFDVTIAIQVTCNPDAARGSEEHKTNVGQMLNIVTALPPAYDDFARTEAGLPLIQREETLLRPAVAATAKKVTGEGEGKAEGEGLTADADMVAAIEKSVVEGLKGSAEMEMAVEGVDS